MGPEQELNLLVTLALVISVMVIIGVLTLTIIFRNRKLEDHHNAMMRQLKQQQQLFESIYREIHDNIGQTLSLAKINLHTVDVNDQEMASQKLDTSQQLVGQAIRDLRNLATPIETHLKKP